MDRVRRLALRGDVFGGLAGRQRVVVLRSSDRLLRRFVNDRGRGNCERKPSYQYVDIDSRLGSWLASDAWMVIFGSHFTHR